MQVGIGLESFVTFRSDISLQPARPNSRCRTPIVFACAIIGTHPMREMK